MNGLYTIEELVECIKDEYQLDQSTDDADKNYYMRIYRALKKLNILDKGIVLVNPVTHRKCRYYSEHDKQAILSEKSLYDYLRNNSTSDVIKNSKRYNEILNNIDSRRNAHIRYLDSRTQDICDNSISVITQEEFQNYKNQIMLTALFEKFFTPINDELLYNDLNQFHIIRDELHLQIEDIQAEERLQHPKGAYYQEKSNQNED